MANLAYPNAQPPPDLLAFLLKRRQLFSTKQSHNRRYVPNLVTNYPIACMRSTKCSQIVNKQMRARDAVCSNNAFHLRDDPDRTARMGSLGRWRQSLKREQRGQARKSAQWMSLSFWPISTFDLCCNQGRSPSSSSVAHSLNTPFPSASRSSSVVDPPLSYETL